MMKTVVEEKERREGGASSFRISTLLAISASIYLCAFVPCVFALVLHMSVQGIHLHLLRTTLHHTTGPYSLSNSRPETRLPLHLFHPPTTTSNKGGMEIGRSINSPNNKSGGKGSTPRSPFTYLGQFLSRPHFP